MSRPSKNYRSSHQVFGELEVVLQVGGSDDKNNKSTFSINNLSGCYPFIITTPSRMISGVESVEIELMGGGEESSLIECLADIIDQLKKDGWVSHREIKKRKG